jgi:transposase
MTRGNGNSYPPEVRERAVRMVMGHRGEYASECEAISSIASKIGCKAETLRLWVRRAERDAGFGLGTRARSICGSADRAFKGRSTVQRATSKPSRCNCRHTLRTP